MKKVDNYLHDFLRVFFANFTFIKRIFLTFAVLTLLLPLFLKDRYDINAEVIVQSKKLSQSDSSSSLIADADKFIPPSIADMETESNILRSTTLVRQTIEQLNNEGLIPQNPPGFFQSKVVMPLKELLIKPITSIFKPEQTPSSAEIINEQDPYITQLTEAATSDLTVGTIPGANVISVNYASADPHLGTLFVKRLLHNYLISRQELQSNELPKDFYEQKKDHYQQQINRLEHKRVALLESANASEPKEEMTFRLNAINTEEQSLNTYRDQALESENWIKYLKHHLAIALKSKKANYTFPFTFTQSADKTAFEDREIKQLGERLSEQISRLSELNATFQADSLPVKDQRQQIQQTHQRFLEIIENRIAERTHELEVVNEVIKQKEERIDEYKDRIRTLQELQSSLRQLDTEIDALHHAFFAYTQRFEESQGARLLDSDLSNARILSDPQTPTSPSFPKPLQIIPLGLITGFLLAIAFGYVREFFDHRFKVPTEVQEHLNLPVLLIINHAEEETQHKKKRLPNWLRK